MTGKRQFVIVDRNGEPVAEPFESERKAYEAMAVYRDHCDDIQLPMRVVKDDAYLADLASAVDPRN